MKDFTAKATGESDHDRTCSRCVMDATAPRIDLDESKVCRFCRHFDEVKVIVEEQRRSVSLDHLVAEVKRRAGTGKYDCLIGLSGGVDSSYVAYLAWKLGLKCLAVHFDNGWNSEIAVSNIKNIVRTTGFDFYTYVIDWPEFRNLQRAIIKASVVDIELVTDHAIFAAMYRLCRKNRIKSILSGTNFATENGMPAEWSWNKQDLTNLKAINRQFGEMPIRNLPTIGSLRWQLMLRCNLGPRFVEPLDLIEYRKNDAIQTLKEVFGWREYGGKHYESVFTKFYQGFILPAKFGIDKRRVHLSALVRNHEITRAQALEELAKPIYPEDELKVDRAFVLKKLGFTEDEFDRLMGEPIRRHDDYESEWASTRRFLDWGVAGKRLIRRLSGKKQSRATGR